MSSTSKQIDDAKKIAESVGNDQVQTDKVSTEQPDIQVEEDATMAGMNRENMPVVEGKEVASVIGDREIAPLVGLGQEQLLAKQFVDPTIRAEEQTSISEEQMTTAERNTQISSGQAKAANALLKSEGYEGGYDETVEPQGEDQGQGEGQDVQQGEGQDVQQGEGQDVQQGEGQDVQQGEGQDVQQGEGQDVQQGEGQDVQQGEGQVDVGNVPADQVVETTVVEGPSDGGSADSAGGDISATSIDVPTSAALLTPRRKQ